MTTSTTPQDRTRHAHAEVAREYVPLPDCTRVQGVAFDGELVWFSSTDEVVAFDPSTECVVRRWPVPGADAGTAFDGKHLYQLAKGEVVVLDPADGRVVRRFRAPTDGLSSGMAWSDGYLFIGQFREGRIHKVDAKTGEVVKTLASDRYITGVACIDGEVWHGASFDGKPSELRHVAADGTVVEALQVPVEMISGVDGAEGGGFWCGGENGTVRLVRRT